MTPQCCTGRGRANDPAPIAASDRTHNPVVRTFAPRGPGYGSVTGTGSSK